MVLAGLHGYYRHGNSKRERQASLPEAAPATDSTDGQLAGAQGPFAVSAQVSPLYSTSHKQGLGAEGDLEGPAPGPSAEGNVQIMM